MRVGMNLFLWTDDPCDEAWLPLYERLATIGFDGVELPVFDTDVDRFRALGRRLDDLGLERTGCSVRAPESDPISADAAVRAEALAESKRVVDCCEAVGAKLLCGPLYAALGQFSGAGPTKEEWDRSVDVMRDVADHAASADVSLAFEFLNRFEIYLLNTTEGHGALRLRRRAPQRGNPLRHVPRAYRREGPGGGDPHARRVDHSRTHLGE